MLLVAAAALLAAGTAYAWTQVVDDAEPEDASASPSTSPTEAPTTTAPPVTTTTAPPFRGWVDPASACQPFPNATVEGLLTFRGNPTRNYYGQGPVPREPHEQWTYPGSAMCSESTDGEGTRTWCGTGWTGEPAVFERDGRTWVVFGAYDRAVHFVDAATGQDIIPPFPTGDIIKGSVTIDPDGYPLVYFGSRDNYLRVLAIDRPQPTELWKLSADAVSPTMWNDDWDGSPVIIGDYLFEGGENSQFHIVKLNRGYSGDGLAQVAPQLVFNAPGWDDELLSRRGRHRGVDRELGGHLGQHRLLRQLRRARPGLGPHRGPPGRSRRGGCSASGPATTPTPASWSTRGDALRRPRSGSATTPGRPTSARS